MPIEGQRGSRGLGLCGAEHGLKVGDVISKPESEDAYAPHRSKLVGVLHGPVWIGLTNKAFVDANSPLTFVGHLAFAPTADEHAQRRLDTAMVECGRQENSARMAVFGLGA